MAQQTATIVIDGQDKASAEIDKSISSLQRLSGQSREASSSFKGMAKDTGQTTSQLGTLARGAGVAAAAFIAFDAAQKTLSKLKDTVIDLNQVLGQHEKEVIKLERMTTRFSKSVAAGHENLLAVTEQVEQMSQRTGSSVREISSIMTDLTLRFQDSTKAGENLERALGIMELTGDSASRTARALSEAYQGNFGVLQRMGVLTRRQAEEFSNATDKSKALSEALGLIDNNIQGLIDTTIDSIDSVQSLSTSFERMKIAIAQMVGVDRIMARVARGVDAIASSIEGVSKVFQREGRGITAVLEEMNKSLGLADDILNRSEEERNFRRLELDTRQINFEIDQRIEKYRLMAEEHGKIAYINGTFTDTEREIARLEQERLTRIQARRDALITERNIIQDQSDFQLQQAKIEEQLLNARTEEEKIRLQFRIDQNEIIREYHLRINELITDEGQVTDEIMRQALNQEMVNALVQADAEMREKIAALNTGHINQIKELTALEKAAIGLRINALDEESEYNRIRLESEAEYLELLNQGLKPLEFSLELRRLEVREQERLNQLAQQERRLIEEKNRELDRSVQLRIKENEQSIKETQRLIDQTRGQTFTGKTALQIAAEDAERDARIIREAAYSYTRSMGLIGSTFIQTSQMLSGRAREESNEITEQIRLYEELRNKQIEQGLDTSSYDAHLDALRQENQELQENIRLQQERFEALNRTTEFLGDLSYSIGEVGAQQWNFSKASESVVSAQMALSQAAGSALQAAGLGIREQAKWMAIFEGAQAAASLGMALAFPSPNYWASFAQHTMAATQFGLIAGGVLGGGSGTTKATGASTVNPTGYIRDDMLNHALEASKKDQEERSITITINNDFGRGNAYLEDNHTTSRRIVDAIITDLRPLI